MAKAKNTEKKKQLPITTPKGELLFVFLNDPDTRHDDKNGGVYHLNIIFDAEDAFLDDVEKMARKMFDEFVPTLKEEDADVACYVSPIKVVKDKDKNVVEGKKMLYCKTNATYKDKKTGEIKSLKPKLFDSQGDPITKKLPIGNGTIAQVNFSPRSSKMSGEDRRTGERYCDCFTTLYLNAVAIHELVSYGQGAEGFGFDTGGGGFAAATSRFDQDDTGPEAAGVDEDF